MSKYNIRKATDAEIKEFCKQLEYNPCVDISGIVLEHVSDGSYMFVVPPIVAVADGIEGIEQSDAVKRCGFLRHGGLLLIYARGRNARASAAPAPHR